MYAIAIIRYRRALEDVLRVLDAHRAYLGGLRERGQLLASGPFDPRAGGLLILRVDDAAPGDALDAIRDGDPFVREGIAQYETQLWAPTIGKEDLDRIAAAPGA
ncbi:MAG TPA: YciI family protein [Thermoanaerobaculia bacterium]|nr:YciI family protein [Thermoanaerobaculia bacterium]